MATYEVKGPDGATYKVEGPDGATDAQIIDAVKAQIAGEEKVEEPTLPQSGIYAGVERDVSTTDASLPDEAVAEQSVGARFVEKVNDYDPTKDEGVAQELFEGIASGVIGIGQGIGELGASAVDAASARFGRRAQHRWLYFRLYRFATGWLRYCFETSGKTFAAAPCSLPAGGE